jgi:S-adenosylmethionine decarboxylase
MTVFATAAPAPPVAATAAEAVPGVEPSYADFGPHLMLDCQRCDYEKISDLRYVFDVLNNLPDAIGMTKITQPYVFPYEGKVPEDRGITGMVIIAESHITFHSFIDKDYFFFDLFSCKDFDVDRVVAYVIEAFGVQQFVKHQANRGRNFPRSEAMLPETQVVSPALRLRTPAMAEPAQTVTITQAPYLLLEQHGAADNNAPLLPPPTPVLSGCC